MNDDTKHIERDLEETRERLGATIDALQEKLSPGQVVDQALGWVRANGGAEFGQNLMRSVRDNPMPVALVGLGVAWLMMQGNRPPGYAYRDRDWDYRDRRWRGHGADELVPRSEPGWSAGYPAGYTGNGHAHERSLADRARTAAESLSRRADETVEAFEERMYEAKAGVLGVARSVGETLAAFKRRVDDAMSAAANAASATASPTRRCRWRSWTCRGSTATTC